MKKIPKSRPFSLEKTMTILDDIIKYKQNEELPKQMQAREPAVVRAEAALAPKPRDFVAALRATDRVALIGEIKKASPSKGLLRHHFDPVELAQTYAANGAAAISVLTDVKYFQGKLEYLTQIRQHLKTTGDRRQKTADPFDKLRAGRRPIRQAQGKPQTGSPRPRVLASLPPLLRKDFIFHPYQVYEARAAGADALLLIAAVLKDKELADLLKVTHELGLTA
ncbi:MAG: indole-3-glycerol-phosphate synthase [Anaerolineales bacterium]|nr:indole-3-glycerol-phosphate synthase [Anaerolineales bacterium]